MKPIRLLLAGLVLLALSACYTSEAPLVGDDAVAPYAAITFTPRGDADPKPVAFTRDGNGYLTVGDNSEEVRLHLKPVEGDFHVAQLSGEGNDGSPQYLYGFMRLDAGAGTADVWMTLGAETDAGPGLRPCDNVICIDDLDAYVTRGQAAVAAGEEPELSFDIVVQ